MKQNTKKTILIVDDTKINLEILIELLDDAYDIVVSLSGKRALEIVQNTKIDLILLDILIPDIDGYEVCKVLKADPNTQSIPVIFITANTDEASIQTAYEVGGIDYITKPVKSLELLARVKTQLNMQALLQELEESHESMKLLASQDHMTKLYNRRYFSDVSQKIAELSLRNNKHLSIVMLDIDNFKNINDTYGHHIGDEVIITLADTLKKYSRQSDIVCRFGGEEFLILLPETDLEGSYVIAEKIRSSVAKIAFSVANEETLSFTISAGVSEFTKEQTNLEECINNADEALYEAKESGRNRVCKR